jgi:hypothetical protein
LRASIPPAEAPIAIMSRRSLFIEETGSLSGGTHR